MLVEGATRGLHHDAVLPARTRRSAQRLRAHRRRAASRSDHRARARDRSALGAAGEPPDVRTAARKPACGSSNTSPGMTHVKSAGRRRSLVGDRHDQPRQPVVRTQRRSERGDPRRGRGGAAARATSTPTSRAERARSRWRPGDAPDLGKTDRHGRLDSRTAAVTPVTTSAYSVLADRVVVQISICSARHRAVGLFAGVAIFPAFDVVQVLLARQQRAVADVVLQVRDGSRSGAGAIRPSPTPGRSGACPDRRSRTA